MSVPGNDDGFSPTAAGWTCLVLGTFWAIAAIGASLGTPTWTHMLGVLVCNIGVIAFPFMAGGFCLVKGIKGKAWGINLIVAGLSLMLVTLLPVPGQAEKEPAPEGAWVVGMIFSSIFPVIGAVLLVRSRSSQVADYRLPKTPTTKPRQDKFLGSLFGPPKEKCVMCGHVGQVVKQGVTLPDWQRKMSLFERPTGEFACGGCLEKAVDAPTVNLEMKLLPNNKAEFAAARKHEVQSARSKANRCTNCGGYLWFNWLSKRSTHPGCDTFRFDSEL